MFAKCQQTQSKKSQPARLGPAQESRLLLERLDILKALNNDLPYGHFGQAVYDPDEEAWNFQREIDYAYSLHPLGSAKIVTEPPKDGNAPVDAPVTPLIASERHKRQIKHLVERLSDVQPATALLGPLLRVSEAIESASARHDPLQGELLAIGTVPAEALHSTLTLAVFPSGPTGGDMRLIQMQMQRHGWDDAKDAWIKVPTTHGMEAKWHGEGVPIQQICFAHAIEGSDAFIAARMPTQTVGFRPAVRSRGPSAWALDVNVCFQVSIASTGAVPHADVVFNPWYTRQFGIVDQAGNWSVYELEGLASTKSKLVCRSGLSTGVSRPVDDGWARIAWVGNPSTIAVCTRRQLDLYNIAGQDSNKSNPIATITSVGSSWHLALVQVPSHPAHLAVLTSTHVLLYHMKADESTINAKTLLKLRHFRNPEDTTLTVAVFTLEDATLVVLRSGVEPVMTIYRLKIDEYGGVQASLPVAFSLPGNTNDSASITGLHLAPAQYGSRRREPDTSLALEYRDAEMRFASLISLSKDLTLQECLYVSIPSSTLDSNVVPPAWTGKLPASTTRLRKEKFVVDDDDEDDAFGNKFSREAPLSFYQQRKHSQAPVRTGLSWTISLERTAQAMIDNAAQQTVPIDDVLETAEVILREQRTDEALPYRTLHDYAQGTLICQDIDDAAAKLDGLASIEPPPREASQDSATDDQSKLKLALHTLRTSESLAEVYAAMVRNWITPLSPSVPSRIRLAKEQLVRQAAAEVTFASRIIRTQAAEPEVQAVTQQSQESFDIPVRAGPSSSQLPGSSQTASQQSVLPTPSPTATPSVTTGSSHVSTFAAPEIARLSQYTIFSRSAPSALPRSLASVLDHWPGGADPVDYDWRSTSRRVAEHEVEADEQMTEKDQERVRRRAERHLRRQRREAAASEAARVATSQALEIVSASQPQHVPRVENQPTGAVDSSQSQGLGLGAASQVVPGRFGGRPPPKKKRKQGF
ncbi:hypothetical protein LTS12_020150 [Elasticomyces elasticus]|nr:hypothetical protein LTS12_020150 [Elasticomyces elasticus]